MAEAAPTVVVIDDDLRLREALGGLFRSAGIQASLYPSVGAFLEGGYPPGPTCLILDVHLPGQGGLEFQRELAQSAIDLPIIFLTGRGDIPMSVSAMKNGAIEFLTKPFSDHALLEAVRLGLDKDRKRREKDRDDALLRQHFASLSQREREVMALVVGGRLNKQIAEDLGVREITVKFHRANVMRKMQASSLTDLAFMASKLKFGPGS